MRGVSAVHFRLVRAHSSMQRTALCSGCRRLSGHHFQVSARYQFKYTAVRIAHMHPTGDDIGNAAASAPAVHQREIKVYLRRIRPLRQRLRGASHV